MDLRVIPEATPIDHPEEPDGNESAATKRTYPEDGVSAASPTELAEAVDVATSEADTDEEGPDLGDD